MVVVLSFRPWASVKPTVDGERLEDFTIHWDRQFGDGFLPVFEDEGEARALFPECEVLEIRRAPVQAVLRGGGSNAQVSEMP